MLTGSYTISLTIPAPGFPNGAEPSPRTYLLSSEHNGYAGTRRETFHDGDMVSGIYEDCSIRLKKVRETGRDVLRLIIPDKHNRFPEDENCMEPYRHQELEMFEN